MSGGKYVIRVTNLSKWSKEDEIYGFVEYKWQAKKLVREVAKSLYSTISDEKVEKIFHPDSILTSEYSLVWDKTLEKNDCMTINIVRRNNGWMYSIVKPRYRVSAEYILPLTNNF